MAITEQPIINVRGSKVALGPLCQKHLPQFWQWFNDLEVTCTYNPRWSPMSWENLENWYTRATKNEKIFAFAVYELLEMKLIGCTMLLDVNPFHRIADLDIIIGEKSLWRQGLGSEAVKLTLDYGFMILSLCNIMLTVYSFNKAGIRAYEKAGFREFGRRKKARRFGNRICDLVYMECLEADIEDPHLSRLFPEESKE
ncbi:MAG: GNAT family N-acetyltransferase [Leptolyngbya sp. Prado105]|nr:GNAT family N-acetyltransferase [Leptolyngbya sp. Prado105]